MQTIVVTLDGSPQAEQILPHIRLLAPALQANVLLLQVLTDPEHEHIYATTSASQPIPKGKAESDWLHTQQQQWLQACRQTESYLEIQAAPLRASGIAVTCAVELGPPVATIVATAERHRASLIALASHGYSGLRRWASGSVAAQIIKTTDVPVLLVRIAKEPPTTPASLRRVLVPLDGSVFAGYALEHAISIAHGAQSEIIILQTLAPSIEDYLGGAASLLEQREAMRENVRRAYAARWGQQRADQARITTAIGLGSAADAIIEEAQHRNVATDCARDAGAQPAPFPIRR